MLNTRQFDGTIVDRMRKTKAINNAPVDNGYFLIPLNVISSLDEK